MPEEYKPYVEQSPSDILTAEAWNRMQILIKEDIRATAQDEVGKIEEVPRAADSEKLGGLDPDELSDELVKKVLDQVRARSGYLQVFRILNLEDDSWIEHGFGACPLVDVYRLDYFPVVCCEDKDEFPAWTTFYLHHSSEQSLPYSYETASGTKVRGRVEIVPRGGPDCCIPLADMLQRYEVEYGRDTTLGDLETELWKAFFSDPNDRFHDDQYCHSVWFDKCCREEKTVHDLKRSGDWDDLCVQMRPRKVINHMPGSSNATSPTSAPAQVQVTQCGWSKVGLRLLAPPIYSETMFDRELFDEVYSELKGFPLLDEQIPEVRDELKVTVLLKC